MNNHISSVFVEKSQYRFLTFAVVLIVTILFPRQLFAQWAYGAGSTGSDLTTGIAYDGSGNVYITGYFNGSVDFDPGAGTTNLVSNGGDDIFFAKYNSSGALQWAKNIGGSLSDRTSDIKVDGSGNVFIVGFFIGTVDFDPSGTTVNLSSANLTIGDGFFAEYNTSGTLVMAKNFGGSGLEEPNALYLSGSDIYITGEFRGTADFDPGAGNVDLVSNGGTDIFIAQYTSAGAIVFAKGIGGVSNDAGYGIGVDNGAGLIAIAGSFADTVDFDPSVSVTKLVSNNASLDIFIAQYNTSGDFQWAKSFGGTSTDVANDLALDPNNGGDFYITGYYQGTVDFNPSATTNNLTSVASASDIFFAKYDASGGYLFAKSVGGSLGDVGQAITFDGSSNIYITGNFMGNDPDFDPGAGTTTLSDPGNSGVYIAKYNSAGTMQWANGFGSSSTEDGKCIAVDGSGNVFVGGMFGGTVDFDPGSGTTNLTGGGGLDLFFAKYTSSGALPVELISFTVKTQERGIVLTWETATEVNNAGFEIEHLTPSLTLPLQGGRQGGGKWTKIGYVEGHGTTNTPQSYSYTDASAKGAVSYRLKQIDRDGQFEYSPIVETTVSLTVEDFKLAQNYPNPFNPMTMISFATKNAEYVNVTVYNALGQSVATLFDAIANPNNLYSLNFDGSRLSSGTYFTVLRSGSRNEVKRMSLIK